MKVKLKVNLSKPATGQQIADAVQKVAQKEFEKATSVVTDEGVSYLVGQNSSYPYKDVVIGTGPNANPELIMSVIYTDVYVLSWEFGGIKYAIGYNDDSIVQAVREFRDQVQQLL